jgi:type II secretory pathway pseudopilin PulG
MIRSAFTMVELLVATALLIVLASLALLVIPSLNQGQQTPRAASQLQQWIEIAKQRAARDRAARGIRLVVPVFNPAGQPSVQVLQLEFIELPDPYTLHTVVPGTGMMNASVAATDPTGLVTFSGNGAKTLTGGFAQSQLWPVQPGDYIELGGVVHQIAQVNGPVQLKITPSALAPPSLKTTNYKIIRQPRPLGDELLEMAQNIVIDLSPRQFGGIVTPATGLSPSLGKWDLPIVAGQPLDIMFAPDGKVIPSVGSSNLAAYDKIILWVRDTSVPDGQNDPTLVVVYPRTGLVAAQPVDQLYFTNGTSPYTFTTSGQRSSE